MELKEKIAQFKSDIKDVSPVKVLHKHILFADPYVLEPNQYLDLRNEISDKFSIHPTEIFMVGSGKLGFSIAPDKRYRAFGDESDIDIAIVSNTLFLKYWKAAYLNQKNPGNAWETAWDFKKYLFKGWIRPDMFPNCEEANEWWEFFRILTSSGKYGKYHIKAGLYKNWFFFEQYYKSTIENLKE